MSNEVGMFGGNSLVNSDLFKSLQALNDNLAGGSGGGAKAVESVCVVVSSVR